MVIVIDCGLGNNGSVINMIKKVGVEARASADPAEIRIAEKLILPGIGKFDVAMQRLNDLNLRDILEEMVIVKKKPFLGICLGMQLLTEKSEEGILPGLGWIMGKTVRFNFNNLTEKPKIPHMGWNSVIPQRESAFLSPIENELSFYFVHSYHVVCYDQADVLTTTNYGYEFVSAIQKDNIMGVQFHPEKSHIYGMAFLKVFIDGKKLA